MRLQKDRMGQLMFPHARHFQDPAGWFSGALEEPLEPLESLGELRPADEVPLPLLLEPLDVVGPPPLPPPPRRLSFLLVG